MFKVKKTIEIARNSKKYLSFPDIIQNPDNPDNLFLVYREGNEHHPTWSNLVLMESKNGGEKWRKKRTFSMSLKKDYGVWNCPRLSYIDNELVIVCDVKSGTRENLAQWETHIIRKKGRRFITSITEMPGMVPDKIIKFKNKLFCANHKIKSSKNDLIQLVSWSRDDGETWYDTNIVAHSLGHQFCEASITNMGDYLIAYLRDNSGHKMNVWFVTSENGIEWSAPARLSIYGQRVTAIKIGEDKVIGTYRDTNTAELTVGMFEHDIMKAEIKKWDIDWEYGYNQYHFGYTGLVKVGEGSYLVVYYIKQDELNPYIKLAFVNYSVLKQRSF